MLLLVSDRDIPPRIMLIQFTTKLEMQLSVPFARLVRLAHGNWAGHILDFQGNGSVRAGYAFSLRTGPHERSLPELNE